jgi:proteasome beta subunit
VVEALHDAADDDSATGGPDPGRAIYPVVATVSTDGYQRITDDVLAPIAAALVSNEGGEAR